jgi:uncharacterized membrane protein YeaQ/YmgE (transglycosylase-associated protein family)
MSLLDFLLLCAIAGICGSIGQSVSGMSGRGCLVSIGVGLVGAVLGLWLARALRLPMIFSISIGGTAFPVVWAILRGDQLHDPRPRLIAHRLSVASTP